MRVMYDSVNLDAIPADAAMVAGYVDGYWPTFGPAKQRWPKAKVVSITVTGQPGAMVADVEAGDLTPAQGAAWAKRERQSGRHPTLYCSASPWPQVRAAVQAAGLDPDRDVSWWIANYDNDPSLPAGAIAKQYANSPNLDTSSVAAYWPGVDVDPGAPAQSYGLADRHAWWVGHGDYCVDDIPPDARGVWRNGNALAYWDGHGWTDVHQIPPNSAGVHNFAWGAGGWRPS